VARVLWPLAAYSISHASRPLIAIGQAAGSQARHRGSHASQGAGMDRIF